MAIITGKGGEPALKINGKWLRQAPRCTIWNGLRDLQHAYLWLNALKSNIRKNPDLDLEEFVNSRKEFCHNPNPNPNPNPKPRPQP